VPLWPIVNPGTDRGIPDSRIAREIPISFFSTLPSSSFQTACSFSRCLYFLSCCHFSVKVLKDPSICITKQKGRRNDFRERGEEAAVSCWPGLHCDFTGD